MTWHAYHISPIDHGWQFLQSVGDIAAELASNEAREIARSGHALMIDDPTSAEFLNDWQEAKDAAYAQGWEGDFRQGPVVFWLPTETGFTYAFAFKQDNNGSSFIVSPYRLPWMERISM